MTDRSKDNLIRLKETSRRTGLSIRTLYRKMSDGTFPKAVQLSARSVAHYESDIDEWVASRAGTGFG